MKTVVVHSQQRWECMVVTRRSEVTIVEEANIFGQKGWEVVSVLHYKDAKGIAAWSAFLKRPCSSASSSPSEAGESETSIGIASNVAEHAVGSAVSHDSGSAINRGFGGGSTVGRAANSAGGSVAKELRVATSLESEPEPEQDTFELRADE